MIHKSASKSDTKLTAVCKSYPLSHSTLLLTVPGQNIQLHEITGNFHDRSTASVKLLLPPLFRLSLCNNYTCNVAVLSSCMEMRKICSKKKKQHNITKNTKEGKGNWTCIVSMITVHFYGLCDHVTQVIGPISL